MSEKKSSPGMWTPANIVTSVRVVFVPVWLLMAQLLGGVGVGGMAVFVAFCLLSLTDKLDGYLARSRNEVTTFGKFLDPIADKLVVHRGTVLSARDRCSRVVGPARHRLSRVSRERASHGRCHEGRRHRRRKPWQVEDRHDDGLHLRRPARHGHRQLRPHVRVLWPARRCPSCSPSGVAWTTS